MPFLLLWWKPIAAILLVLALVGTVAFAKHRYDEGKRDEGRAEVQAKWDAAVQAQIAREVQAANTAIAEAVKVKGKRDADFNALARRNAQLQARLAAVAIDGVVAGGVRDAIRTANGESPRSVAEDSAPATGLALVNWSAEVAGLYRACREQVGGWIAWDDARVVQ